MWWCYDSLRYIQNRKFCSTKGLKTALVELDDFSSGTSSRSTKLIHGGVRYLQKAILQLDLEQYRMVKEALHERANLLAIAPHLSYPLPIMLPIYRWWQVPYYWIGIKAYDFVAGRQQVKSSYFLSRERALELFPMLKKDKLCGALVYYDGQHNDARMNLAIILTAARLGANVANHVAVTDLIKIKDPQGVEKVNGAKVKDMLTGKEWDIRAKCVINATGPFTDSIRRMDDQKCPMICQPSAGVHIVLPDYYSPESMGLLDPATSDGRVIFFLPWQKMTIAGTTDRPCQVTHHPRPTEDEIQFILNEVKNYLSPEITVRRGDVMSAWSGIRPLVLNPNKDSTESLARNHVLHVSDSNLITIAGGKWTTYRVMAKEAVDAAVKTCNLNPKNECATDGLLLEGASGWTPNMYIRLVQDYGLESEVAQHLANTYGDRAFAVAKQASLTGKRWPIIGRRLHEEYPYIEAEVRYAIYEYACTAVDVIARRLRLSFLNVQATEEALPSIISIMADILKWNKSKQKEEYEKAIEFLHTEMGQDVNRRSRVSPVNFSKDEIKAYTNKFQTLDKDKKGYITLNDLRQNLKAQGEKVDDETLHDMLNEVDLNKNGQVELAEYLLLMSAIKTGAISQSRLAAAVDIQYDRSVSSVDRSGGGV
ncbi:glycerol-3-phosphate dehydrogenase, mitochondrial-like isoform X2 [Stegodyphus dumicola]|uniref:glycerol-3-phosphate dehydrogenase, mitochondrial-like isoform X2 n=1 Tax=Stegodyphus dumicola TaxID=202533 RepID=UPI0015B1AC75|nr:glycerol-3-phosphate dehydrogenase, mitochondrial-like isoform X2 [Stegodyphus dumicola]XP_035230808.1 glycerol-3-phosphate dehydrogenase, mitochondrial-like isoform X2 [Stegodyphus dumicola]